MEPRIREKARQRVKRKKEFINQLITFLSTSAVLFFINIMTSSYLWCLWPIGFYGISIIFQGANLLKDDVVESWEDDALDREYDKLKRKRRQAYKSMPEEEEDYLDLEDLRKTKEPMRRKWDDRDMV